MIQARQEVRLALGLDWLCPLSCRRDGDVEGDERQRPPVPRHQRAAARR